MGEILLILKSMHVMVTLLQTVGSDQFYNTFLWMRKHGYVTITAGNPSNTLLEH